MVVSFLLASAETRTVVVGVVVAAEEEARENRIDEDLDVDAFMDEETEFNGLNESEVCCCAMENMTLGKCIWFFVCSSKFFCARAFVSLGRMCAREWINGDVGLSFSICVLFVCLGFHIKNCSFWPEKLDFAVLAVTKNAILDRRSLTSLC